MALTAAEQYLLELINRARLDPLAEAERYGLSLNASLSAGTISTSAKQVLAPNVILEQAAEQHSNWMLSTDTFSHTGQGQSSPGDRMLDAGYNFAGQWAWRENLAWTGTTAQIDLQAAVSAHHEQLYRSESHRINTFAENIREIGLAQVEGAFSSSGTTFNASMLTLKFAQSGSGSFVTGVAYNDANDNGFYDIGEGHSDLSVATIRGSASAGSAGGYGLISNRNDEAEITLTSDGAEIARLTIDLSDENAKLDYVIDTASAAWLDLSQTADLISGVPNARLLGVANINLTGSGANNVLQGNSGRNTLDGEGGDDQLFGGEGRDHTWDVTSDTFNADILLGGAGNDELHGQSGADSLDGGAGDDTLFGGGGRDTFVFNDGNDAIMDFAANVDRLVLDRGDLGFASRGVEQLEDLVIASGDALTFEFASNDRLTLEGIASLDQIWYDISFS